MTHFIYTVLVLASVAIGATPPLKRLPPLGEVRVFTSVDYPLKRILYGRTITPGRACRPFVIEFDRDHTRQISIANTITQDDGVSVIFTDGSRLVTPTDQASHGASIWYLDRNREHLREQRFDERTMQVLSTRVAFGKGTAPADEYVAPAPPRAGARVYQITIHDPAAAAALDHEGPHLIAQQDHGTSVEWWAFGAEADLVEARARAANIAITRSDALDPARLPAFPPGIGYGPPPARDVWRHINDLERLVRNAKEIEWSIRMFADHERALRSYRENFRRPLDDRIAAAFEQLRTYDSNLGRELYLWGSGTVGPRVAQLDRIAGSNRGTFFTEWLNLLSYRVGWPTRVRNFSANITHIRGYFAPNFPDVNFSLVDYVDPAAVSYLHDYTPTYPLRLFGIKNSSRARNALVSFIAAGDKQAEWQRATLQNDFVQTSISGNRTLASVIRGLPYGAVNHREDPGFPTVKFRPALYYTQVAQVLTELLNTSAVSLVNLATYLTTVDAAITLKREIQREFGVNPSAGGHSLERDQLTLELFKLYAAVEKQTLRMCAIHLVGDGE